MVGFHFEVVVVAELFAKRVKGLLRHLGDSAAGFADEVVVGVVGEVVDGGAVAEVDVVDYALAFEVVEEAVDG